MRIPGGVIAVAAGVLASGAAYLTVLLPGSTPAWPSWGVAGGICLLLYGLLDLGARQEGRTPPHARWIFAGVSAWVALGFAGILAHTPADLDTPLVGGLPLPAAWMIYLLGVGPALLLPLAWIFLFRSTTLPEDALERLEEARRRVEAAAGGGESDARPARSPSPGRHDGTEG
ncbi:MAG: hypothetical protein RQ745_03105 [Longimicrobiales bacterium]|nr:hypothetical protein [Longimicrobiales bacterium]